MFGTVLIVVITLLVGFVTFLFINKRSQPVSIYTKKGFFLTHYLRWIAWIVQVWFHQRQRKPRLNNYRENTRDFKYCGIMPTPQEVKLEEPMPLTTERHEDGVIIWGTDAKGHGVYARVLRLAGNKSCVILVVRDQDGTIYTIPNQPDSTVTHTDGQTWRGAGLYLECVQPMRTWRLKFNGYLRKGGRSQYATEVSAKDEEGVVEARLDLVWRALRAPVDLFRDSDPRLLARALAQEPDADLRFFTSLDRDAYDQAGCLSGLVQLDLSSSLPLVGVVEDMGAEGHYWYLRGGRQRRWGMGEAATNLHRSVEFLNFFDNGDTFYQFTFSYPNSLTHCHFGYLQTASGQYQALSDTSFHLSSIGEDGDIGSHIFFDCSGSFSSGHACISLGKGSALYFSGDPWKLRHDVIFTDTFLGTRKGLGVAVFTSSYSGLCPVPEQFSGSLLALSHEEDSEVLDLPLVSSIHDKQSLDESLTGGKGASLAFISFLDSAHIPEKIQVPRGFIVTRAAWRSQLQNNEALSNALQNLVKAVGFGHENQIKEACTKCSDLFLKLAVCNSVKKAVLSGLEKLSSSKTTNARFAIRSSGSDEDSGEASAAGQNLTILGCSGTEEILSAIPKCWASLVSFTSVQYRRQRGLDPIGEMAVVVQEMVDAQLAGVIFTRHPISGSPSSVTITANYGLGESVVSGSSEPDTITVRRSWRDNLSIQSTVVGKKASKHILASTGTVEASVPQQERDLCCVSETLAMRLAAVAIHVEKAYRSPRDIEFAVVNDEIFLLQARPITNLDSWSELELISELDTAIVSEQELFTRANTGEVLPQASTPLSLSVVGKALDLGVQKTIRGVVPLRRYKLDPSGHRTVMFSFMHGCLNVVEMLLILVEEKVSINNITTDLCVFGHLVTTDAHVQIARERHGTTNFAETTMALMSLLYRTVFSSRVMAIAKERFQQFSIRTERAITAKGLLNKVSLSLPDLIAMSSIHGSISSISSSTQNIAFVMLMEGSKDVSTENIADMAKMLSASCVGQESVGVPLALKCLAETISKDEEVMDFLVMSPDEGCVWLESHPGAVGDEYQLFLELHGHRCIQELEISSLSWGMDGRGLVKTLQTMAASSPESRKERSHSRSVPEILASISSPLKKNTRRGLEFFLPVCRSFVQRREVAKSYTARVINAFRKAYRTLGELMVAEGRLPDSDLIFYFQHHELENLLQTRSPGLIAKAVKRKALRAKMLRLSLPELTEGRYNPYTRSTTDTPPLQSSEVVHGTAACVGLVVGPAVVVHDLDEAVNIKTGDILITYSTDIGWTPYFPLLAGVVTEIGGLISHGAVVAREYGLPCIVGAVGATKLIKSGDRIELNGSTGKISKVSSTA